VQEQLSVGAQRLRDAYRRGRALPRQRAVQDEKLYEQLRRAAGALSEAARRVAADPKRQPRRRGHRLLIATVGTGVLVLVRGMHRRQQELAASPPSPPTEIREEQ
jgi:hypothetical protein